MEEEVVVRVVQEEAAAGGARGGMEVVARAGSRDRAAKAAVRGCALPFVLLEVRSLTLDCPQQRSHQPPQQQQHQQ